MDKFTYSYPQIRRLKSKSIKCKEINQHRNSTTKQVSALYLFNNFVNIAHTYVMRVRVFRYSFIKYILCYNVFKRKSWSFNDYNTETCIICSTNNLMLNNFSIYNIITMLLYSTVRLCNDIFIQLKNKQFQIMYERNYCELSTHCVSKRIQMWIICHLNFYWEIYHGMFCN